MKKLILVFCALAICSATLHAQQKRMVVKKPQPAPSIENVLKNNIELRARTVKLNVYLQDEPRFKVKTTAIIVGFQKNYTEMILLVKDFNAVIYDLEGEPGPANINPVYRAQLVGGAMTLNKDGRIRFPTAEENKSNAPKIFLAIRLDAQQQNAAKKMGNISEQKAKELLKLLPSDN